jgi:hypothetical protein
MACFVCEEKSTDFMDPNSQNGDCPHCGPLVTLNLKNGQCVLEHMGTHILYDSKLDSSEERCGQCLHPTPMCQIYLRKACGIAGSVSVDRKKSSCVNMIHFNYATASTSSDASPCSNVLITCPLCPDDKPAVWTYSLSAHFKERHCLQNPALFPIKVSLVQSEKDGLQRVWGSRFKAQKPCKTKAKNRPSLAISEAHRMRLYLQ